MASAWPPRHLVYLDYLDRIDRDLSSCSRSDSNVGAVVGETHVLDGAAARWSRPRRRFQRTKEIFEIGRVGEQSRSGTDDFRLLSRGGSLPAARRSRFAITKRVAVIAVRTRRAADSTDLGARLYR